MASAMLGGERTEKKQDMNGQRESSTVDAVAASSLLFHRHLFFSCLRLFSYLPTFVFCFPTVGGGGDLPPPIQFPPVFFSRFSHASQSISLTSLSLLPSSFQNTVNL